MQNTKFNHVIEKLKDYWQLFAFGVFLLGYITFAFYIQMNGFAFVVPDLKFLIAFGLIVSILCVPVLVFSQSDEYTWRVILIPWGLSPILFVTDPQQSIPALLSAVGIVALLFDYVDTDKDLNQQEVKKQKINKFLIIFLFILFFILDWQLLGILFINFMFFTNMQSYYKKQNAHNLSYVFAYIFIMSFLVASLVDSRGLTIANMSKTNIKCTLENDLTIQGQLVFQDSDKYYVITTKMQHLSIEKSLIKNPIEFIPHKIDTSNSLLSLVKKAFF